MGGRGATSWCWRRGLVVRAVAAQPAAQERVRRGCRNCRTDLRRSRQVCPPAQRRRRSPSALAPSCKPSSTPLPLYTTARPVIRGMLAGVASQRLTTALAAH